MFLLYGFLSVLFSSECLTLVDGNDYGVLSFGYYLQETNFRTMLNMTLIDCGIECTVRFRCTSINYNSKNRFCQLCEGNSTSNDLQQRKGMIHSDISTWPKEYDCQESCEKASSCSEDKNIITECDFPEQIEFAVVSTATETEVGWKIKYACTDGIIGAGTNPVSTCTENGHWSPIDYTCICGPPPVVVNAVVENISITIGSVISYECVGDYIWTAGNRNLSCQADGDWSQVLFKCSVCADPPIVTNAYVKHVYGVPTTVEYACNHGNPNMYMTGTPHTITCNDGQWTNVLFTCQIGQIRIADETSLFVPFSGTWTGGRLEVFHNGEWGTVCESGWNDEDTKVICNMLGKGEYETVAHGSLLEILLTDGSGKIWLKDVNCWGGESSIFECGHSGWNADGCGHHQDVGVACK